MILFRCPDRPEPCRSPAQCGRDYCRADHMAMSTQAAMCVQFPENNRAQSSVRGGRDE